jgi:osmotically-inducible protein OsmY
VAAAIAAAADALELQGRLLGNERRVEKILRALRASGLEPLLNIEVLAYPRLIVLQGRVPSWYLRELAQVTAESVPGLEIISNRVTVE